MKAIITIITALSLSSCSLTVQPDGTRSWRFDEQAARAIIVYGAK